MDSSGPNNGTATAVREDGMREHSALPALLPQGLDPLTTFRPPPTPEVDTAARHVRRRLPRVQSDTIASSRHQATCAREYAYSRLKTLVLSGRFAPGQRLAEERLSRELGISRTPIREALHKLQSEGLIASLPTRGFAASRDSQAEMEEFNDLRAALEGYALRVICDRATEQQLRQLERTVRRTEDALAFQRLGDVSRWNTHFHAALHEMISDKRRLYRQLVTMRQYAFRYGENERLEPEVGRWTVEGHRRILMALRFRDAELCECAMREHIRRSPGTYPPTEAARRATAPRRPAARGTHGYPRAALTGRSLP